MAVDQDDGWKLFSFIVYAFTTVGLYTISAIYHGSSDARRNFFRKLDYIGIYLKIAGSYTPFMVLAMKGHVGWVILAFVWTLAFLGILSEIFLNFRTRTLSFVIYGVMALTVFPVIHTLMTALPLAGFLMVMAGFACYAVGCIFFFNDEKIPHGHGVWHICVMGGTAFQFLCLLIYLS